MVTKDQVSRARNVLNYAPALADKVIRAADENQADFTMEAIATQLG